MAVTAAAARAGSIRPSRPCRRRRAAAEQVHRRRGGRRGGRWWRVLRLHWRLSLWVEHPRGHRAGMTTPEMAGRGEHGAARAGRAAVRLARPRGGGGGARGCRVGRQHGRRPVGVENPRGHRGGMTTAAVVRGGGIGAALAATAPTAVAPPARRQRRLQGRGSVGALGGAARWQQGWSVGWGGSRACDRWVGRSHRQRPRGLHHPRGHGGGLTTPAVAGRGRIGGLPLTAAPAHTAAPAWRHDGASAR